VTTTVSRFAATRAPCGKTYDGERMTTEDMQGLVTEDLRFACGCLSTREEFHDGSLHHMVMHHNGKLLEDGEQRGE
jgi:hypothetical protein